MSKLSQKELNEAIRVILEERKNRNFLETIEIQIGIREYDTKRDKRFAGTVKLPNIINRNKKVCVLGDDQNCADAKLAGIPCLDLAQIEALQKNQKLIKKLVRKYTAFVAPSSIIQQIPRLFGPALNKAGKFPSVLLPKDKVVDKVQEIQSSVKFQLKKDLSLGVAIGNVEMTQEQIRQNVTFAINFLTSLLKKNWNNIKTITIKSTMGKPQRVYG